ncbi:hypothetical protein D9758_006811 [Tetrapyrgos nigripes]|uniref:Major facilitator superfamily (MFS) profile domain-containing protein n=1 Tax=Tetrapyrgos nigripes TaxID=182062 RepID=A0A8H5CVM9_9AGAR|nr:hypothetical protein D9758_006811 [Tetrapyrgos nigripes]
MTLNLPRIPSRRHSRLTNPYHAIHNLTLLQQALFWSGWLAWISDSYDFFCVSLTVLRLNDQFGQDTHSLTTAITLTLLLRPVGATIFGVLSDRYGRKWPLVSALVIISALQIGTGFVNTFHGFLAVRSLFGIGDCSWLESSNEADNVSLLKSSAMGGVWACALQVSLWVAMLIQNYRDWPVLPLWNLCLCLLAVYTPLDIQADTQVQFLFKMHAFYSSQLAEQLVASVVNLFLVPKVPQTWRTIYWVGAGITAFAAICRALLPESKVFTRSRKVAQGAELSPSAETRIFMRSLKQMWKDHWKLWVYAVVLMSGMNFLAHGSQDLYTTFMENSKGFSSDLATKANIIGETGAVIGALFGGFVSQFLGRRITLIVACLWCCAFIPLWIIPDDWSALTVGAFFFQAGVNIAWGTIAVHLNELAPPAFRGLFPGTVYQLGNMASAAAAQIEATAGLSIRLTVNGQDQPDYGKIQAIVAAASCGLVILSCISSLFTFDEDIRRSLTDEKTAIEEGTIIKPPDPDRALKVPTQEHKSLDQDSEKGEIAHIENN